MSEPIRLGYPITFTCSKCRKDFHALANVRQDDNTICVRGLLCYDCTGQTKLELDFDV